MSDSGLRGSGLRQSPVRRVYPSGAVVWIARFRGPDGRRRLAKPSWNGGKATFHRKRDAQQAIDEALNAAYGLGVITAKTVGSYFETWTARHPRSDRTNRTNNHRISRVLDCEVEGRPFRDWPLADLRRRHVYAIVEALLGPQGRSITGAVGILRALSAMTEDAITDEAAELNPFKGVRLSSNDPRARKSARSTRIWSFEQMHAFASGAGRYEPMVRTFADTGMRLGEVLPLRRTDFSPGIFSVVRTAHEGEILDGTKTDHGKPNAGRKVPCPPALERMIREMPRRIDTDLLFPTPTGRLWRERNFYRDVWYPTQRASGLDIRPHEMRHSYVSHLRAAAAVDDADLAAITGHRVETMLSRYTHPLNRSFDSVRELIG